MARPESKIQFDALAIEGGLFTADWLGKIASFAAPMQSDADYGVRAGFALREEIALAWRAAQALWAQFAVARGTAGHDAVAISQKFSSELLKQAFGFSAHASTSPQEADGRLFPIGYFASDGTVPVVIGSHVATLDESDPVFGDSSGERIRRRSAFGLVQEYLNARNGALWGIAVNGFVLRIARDNSSLTRPAWFEADLERLFTEERFAEFSVLWLVAHATRFGGENVSPKECVLERWRDACREQGVTARGELRRGVEQALLDLGTGFLAHPANTALRESLATGQLTTKNYFQQLLRLVYRQIFLLTVEERGILHRDDCAADTRSLYAEGYALRRLRDRAVRRNAHDRHHDLWEGLKLVWRGLARGEARLGLPPLGGLFEDSQCPDLDRAKLENRYLLRGLFHLAWLRDRNQANAPLARVNWRDMGPEELGSIYESLLELVPQIGEGSRSFGFLEGDETRGNARKTSGSYYTPDNLVQLLLDSALDPVISEKLANHPLGDGAIDALLSISVVDPACGSGHFLLAAARRIAVQLARVQAEKRGRGQPTPTDYRHALRQVTTSCIYGVDLNPMAVELARITLWLEGYTSDAPLGFLEHHIRCGNALLGIVDASVLKEGIPEKAFNALAGDDQQIANALKTTNKDALKAIKRLREMARHMDGLALEVESQATALETLPDNSLEAIEAKQSAFEQLEATASHSRARLSADLFVSAFFTPKITSSRDFVPTSQDLYLQLTDGSSRRGVLAAASAMARSVRALHWWQVFPQIRAKGGFDVLLGNPPWDQLVFREQEFFAATAPIVAQARTSNERAKLVKELASQNPVLYREYLDELRKTEAQRLLVQDGGQFPLTGRGRSNTFSLFAELSWRLVKSTGRVGIVVPTGILTDDTTKIFFQDLVKTNSLVSAFDFENRLALFPDVDSRTKFCLITLRGIGHAESSAKPVFVFFAHDPSQVSDPERRLLLDVLDFERLNPNTRTACIFRTRRDADITLRMYRENPVLFREGDPTGDPWRISTRPGLFNMAGHSSIFQSRNELIGRGGVLNGNVIALGREKYLPLYEGKMIGLYDHRAADVVISQTAALRQGQSEALSDNDHADPGRHPLPRHWVAESLVVDQVGMQWDRKWMIGWKEITSPTNERTMIPAVIPLVAIGHKFPIFMLGSETRASAVYLLACLSSLVCDFVVRQKLGTTSLTPFTVKQLPVLAPDQFDNSDKAFIRSRVLELTYTADDLNFWANDLGYDGPPFAWDPSHRALLRAELDAYFAMLYGLSRDDLRYVLDPKEVMGENYPSESFRVLKDRETREFGEFRTRRLVLESWDRLFGATQ